MNRKLWLLNFALAGASVFAGVRLHQESLAAKAREAAMLAKKTPPAPAPPFQPLPPTPQVAASGYVDIAQKMLFDPSRNPTVAIEVPPPPPPPPPMPPLPVYHGMMNLGDGPVAMMSVTAGAPHQGIHLGDTIGRFKLLDVSNDEIVLEWNGKVVHRRTNDLLDKTTPAAPAGPAAGAAPPAPPPVVKTEIGPGGDSGRGFRLCDNNDSLPAGTIRDGYVKVLTPTPFGNGCRWDPVSGTR